MYEGKNMRLCVRGMNVRLCVRVTNVRLCEGGKCEAVCEGDECEAVCEGTECTAAIDVCNGYHTWKLIHTSLPLSHSDIHPNILPLHTQPLTHSLTFISLALVRILPFSRPR